MTVPPLFVYGTLRDPDILTAVLGRTAAPDDLVGATAPDCAAVYFPGQLYPALVQRLGSVAPGLLLRATPADLTALDAFEGGEYRRAAVPVMTPHGPVAAEAYWPAIPVSALAAAWTLEHWVSAHKPSVLARETALAQAVRLGIGQR